MYCDIIKIVEHESPFGKPSLSTTLRAVSIFLENSWGRTENKKASERDSKRDMRHAQRITCFAFSTTDFQGKERLLAV